MRTVRPVSPGEMLEEEFLKPLGLTKYRLAKDIGVPAQRIGDIVAGRRGITTDTDLRLNLPPAEAIARAERAARVMGWRIVAVAPEALRIEAPDTTLFFSFKDDIVIRVRPSDNGCVVDMRSLSRVGTSDVASTTAPDVFNSSPLLHRGSRTGTPPPAHASRGALDRRQSAP